MFNINYNPDVLSCLANLSNDEVFTPPSLANDMLDLLPKKLWSDKTVTFLDPVSKSGVFLREIAKRLLEGLKEEIPDQQARINHIFTKQLYGIAITELTALLSRRSVYCSKTANGKYSIAEAFNNEQGNIKFDRIEHTWHKGKCTFCGATKKVYGRGEEMETYAYQFIHTHEPEKLFNMKFDVIVGNPPYQLNVGVEKENYAIPLYHIFVEQAKKLKPRFITMIIPSRWFTGGRGLNQFRDDMLSDKRLESIVDFADSRDCFPGVDVAGGVMYFLWSSDYNGSCSFTNIHGMKTSTKSRNLNKFPIFPRFNEATQIIEKVLSLKEKMLSSTVSAQTPFGLYTNFKGKKKAFTNSFKVHSSSGIQYIDKSQITKNAHIIDKWKVIFSKATSEHGGQVGKSGKRRVLSTIKVIDTNSICTQSYLIADVTESKSQAINLLSYLKTSFVRFLLLQATTSQDLSKSKFCFVPVQDYNKEWTDEKLYKKYGITVEEQAFIDSLIRPMN